MAQGHIQLYRALVRAASTGSIIGPVLGGFILSATSWRWIFLINIPIGIAGTFPGYRYPREISPRRSGEHVDLRRRGGDITGAGAGGT